MWDQAEFIEEAEAISGEKRKKLQQRRNVLGEYKTENHKKSLN